MEIFPNPKNSKEFSNDKLEDNRNHKQPQVTDKIVLFWNVSKPA
jgi:hypothetical protein